MEINKAICRTFYFIKRSNKVVHVTLGILSIVFGSYAIINLNRISIVLFIISSSLLGFSAFPLLNEVPRDKTVATPVFNHIRFATTHKKEFVRMVWTICYLNCRLLIKTETLWLMKINVYQFIMPFFAFKSVRINWIKSPIKIGDLLLLADLVTSQICRGEFDTYNEVVTTKFIMLIQVLLILDTFLFTLSFRNIVSLQFVYWLTSFQMFCIMGYIAMYLILSMSYSVQSMLCVVVIITIFTVVTIQKSQNTENSKKTQLKIISPGFPRAGSASLSRAIDILGYGPVWHSTTISPLLLQKTVTFFISNPLGETLTQEYSHNFIQATQCSVMMDLAVVGYWREYLKYYPQAKVIVTTREYEQMQQSQKCLLANFDTWWYKQLCNFSSVAYWLKHVLNRKWATNLGFKSVEQMTNCDLSVYAEKHNNTLKEIAKLVPEKNLLIFDVKDGWEPLCAFLNVKIPKNVPFPHANKKNQVVFQLIWRNFAALYTIIIVNLKHSLLLPWLKNTQ